MIASAFTFVARAKKPEVVAALALALALGVLPDCCLNGSHAYGFGMDTFASDLPRSALSLEEIPRCK